MIVVKVFFTILIVALCVVLVADTARWVYRKIKKAKADKKSKEHKTESNDNKEQE